MQYSFQLYSSRNHPDMGEMLKVLSQLGYTQVEGFGGLYADAESLAAMLKANNLTMPTGHFGLEMLEDVDASLKAAETLGIKMLFCPAVGPEQRGQDDAGWVALAEKLARLGEIYKKAGYTFGWHNHDFEFQPTSSGKLPMEIILDTASDIAWECDVAWVAKGDHDPLEWIKRYANRIVSIHVKDIAPAGECLDEDGWADVGEGTMDWKAIIDKVKADTNCQYFVMEHDKPSDAVRFATRSMAATKSFGA